MTREGSFFVAALLFLIANNLHLVTSNGFLPRALDVLAMASLAWGLFLFFKKG
ncbi:MAG: hypothetical protein ACOCUF_03235 [Patescibacteria group bacterium]